MTILIVEDHADSLACLTLFLSGYGYEVASATSLAEARAKLTCARFDLLICDVGLPDGTGWELLENLSDKVPPAIAMSGFGTAEDRAKSLASGFRRHLLKPLNLAELDLATDELWPRRDN